MTALVRVDVDARLEADGVCVTAAVIGDPPRPLASGVFFDVERSCTAEYRALKLAMDAAADVGLEDVVFRCDHRATVDVANGLGRRRRIHGGPRLRDLLEAHPGWRVVWIPRERNTAAHKLCEQRMKRWRVRNSGREAVGV